MSVLFKFSFYDRRVLLRGTASQSMAVVSASGRDKRWRVWQWKSLNKILHVQKSGFSQTKISHGYLGDLTRGCFSRLFGFGRMVVTMLLRCRFLCTRELIEVDLTCSKPAKPAVQPSMFQFMSFLAEGSEDAKDAKDAKGSPNELSGPSGETPDLKHQIDSLMHALMDKDKKIEVEGPDRQANDFC